MTWLEKENISVSPKFEAHCAEDLTPQPGCEHFPSSLLRTRPISSTALPSTVKLTSCAVRFVKTLYPEEDSGGKESFKVSFVIEGLGQTHAEAEQNVWQAPSMWMRIEFPSTSQGLSKGFSRGFKRSFHEVLESLLSPRGPLVLCGDPTQGGFSKIPATSTRAIHTLSYLFRHPSDLLGRPLPKLSQRESPADYVAHAANYLKGCYVSDSSDIFTHWGTLYSGHPTADGLKFVNTSGGMPRVFQPPPGAYTLRPKLIQLPGSCCASVLLLYGAAGDCEAGGAACEFLEECLGLSPGESGARDLDPLRLKGGLPELGEVADDRGPGVVHGHAAGEEGCDVDARE
jgi:hypothetical protein